MSFIRTRHSHRKHYENDLVSCFLTEPLLIGDKHKFDLNQWFVIFVFL
ncbi:hypothetical protein GCK65_03635 [Aeromonas hydrophila]|nr:hypothetical protein GCK65_03635 [Aeromonas hydrophila]